MIKLSVRAGYLGLLLAAMHTGMGSATAQDFCVVCATPAGVYRCVPEGAGPGQSASLKLLCITTLAREGGHEVCSVRSGAAVDCDGPTRQVSAASDAAPATEAQAPVVPDRKPVEPAASTRSPAKTEPPKTVEEAVRRAAKSTGEGVGEAGSAVGNAAKKTWNCLTSLFKSC